MKMMRLVVLALLSLAACRQDETAAAYGAEGKIWQLQTIDGADFGDMATIKFEGQKISGQAPCNRFFTEQDKPYPWIDLSKLASTRMACPELAAETAFLTALSKMTLIEVSGDVLILSTDDGQEMVFRETPDDG